MDHLTRIEENLKRFEKTNQYLVKEAVVASVEKNNLWTKTQIGSEKTQRDNNFRHQFLENLGYNPKKRKKYGCMVSGEEGNGDRVVVAHIAPAVSEYSKLAKIGLTPGDVSSPRNGLLLCANIENSYNKLQLTFVKDKNIFSSQLVVKIWDSQCLNIPLWNGSTKFIGQYDGSKLNLGEHKPFMRALSYHAYESYLKYCYLPQFKSLVPCEYGSGNDSDYFKERNMFKEIVEKAIEEEMDEDV